MTTVRLDAYDPAWPEIYARQADLIAIALGADVRRIAHVGSTSVPGLAAKPVIDIALEVPDSKDEAAYLPILAAAGFNFAFREPDWFGHRMLSRETPAVNLHVFPAGCAETDRMLAFRDHLRAHPAELALYAAEKAELAARDWPSVQAYADAKSDVVQVILRRAGIVP
jgi:GrpB-like predicted nucleotidyltransferase (UPF0157 family)